MDFVSAIKAVRPTGIIGVSTIPKSFNKEVQPSLRHFPIACTCASRVHLIR